MTKAQFLEDPLKALYRASLELDAIPPDWMAEAWAMEEVRREITYGLARMVSKTGELAHSDSFLELLARSLDFDQVVWLYRDIREQSHRHESEWRDEFERRFWRCADRLPFPLDFPEIDRYLNGEELSVGWARDAWEDELAREFLTDHMAEDVARGGDSWNRPDWIEQLDLSLNRDQVVQLYLEIRDRSGRPERDWRPAFESAFPDCVRHLPSTLIDNSD